MVQASVREHGYCQDSASPRVRFQRLNLGPVLLRRKAENEHSDRGGPQQGTSASCHQQNAVCSCPE